MIKIYTIKGKNVYPIFKNGSSSVLAYSSANNIRPLIDGQARCVDTVTAYLREPGDRFIAGVHSFIEFERRKAHIDYDTTLHFIHSHGLSNEHFEPQFNWIKKLSTHFEGRLELLPVSDLVGLISNRNRPGIPEITQEQRDKIDSIQPKHTADRLLMEYLGTTLPVRTVVERIEDALS